MNGSDVAVSLGGVFSLIVPEILLLVVACVLFVGSTIRANRNLWGGVAVFGLFLAAYALWLTAAKVPTIEARAENGENISTMLFTSSILQTRLSLLVSAIALVGGLVLVLFSWNEVPDQHAGEYHACLLLSVAGLMVTGAANDLITLFLALELISIPTYVLLYLLRHDRAAQEASAKYFLLSIFSSGLLLFGFSYMYGMTGTTNIAALLDALARDPNRLPALALVALVMVVAGMGFKITAVPFHFYAPDVYQGSAPAGAAFLAFMPKAAGFVALLLVLGYTWIGGPVRGLALGPQVPILFLILAALTMCVGNVLAILQDNVKRMLAYSSVAHAGYMLIGLAVAPDLSYSTGKPITGGAEAVLFYLVAYSAMTLGAFAVITLLSTPERPVETVDDLAGLSSSHPGVAILMALFLFSLIGIPLTAGFAGKFLIFFGALAIPADQVQLSEHALWFWRLALIGAVNAAIGAWYYLRIVSAMYLRTPIKPIEQHPSWPGVTAMLICAAVTLGLGVYPWPMVKAARAAILSERSTDARTEPLAKTRND
ncbi:MAG: NADH-quinone oxidoreductase subunit N [Gemmataceae bacterium]|nr:NADH-quinone oxidoreductase subunit N [Gemmataceae bacterium]